MLREGDCVDEGTGADCAAAADDDNDDDDDAAGVGCAVETRPPRRNCNVSGNWELGSSCIARRYCRTGWPATATSTSPAITPRLQALPAATTLVTRGNPLGLVSSAARLTELPPVPPSSEPDPPPVLLPLRLLLAANWDMLYSLSLKVNPRGGPSNWMAYSNISRNSSSTSSCLDACCCCCCSKELLGVLRLGLCGELVPAAETMDMYSVAAFWQLKLLLLGGETEKLSDELYPLHPNPSPDPDADDAKSIDFVANPSPFPCSKYDCVLNCELRDVD